MRRFNLIPTVLLILMVVALTACGGGEAGGTQTQGQATTSTNTSSLGQPTATGNVTSGTNGSSQESNGSVQGFDLSKVEPCALLEREEAEALMGPLDWVLRPASDNDPTLGLSCNYDEWGRGSTPEKSLVVRVLAPKMVVVEFGGELQGEGASLIPRQEVGLASEAAIRYEATHHIAAMLPLCNGEFPCVIGGEGSEWLRLTAIMPDSSALRIEIDPQNLDHAKQLARKIIERLPLK
jgi:hypothetical protein